MGVIATAVRHLLAAGVNGEALIEAITEIEAAAETVKRDVTRYAAPSTTAERMRRYREKKKAEKTTGCAAQDVRGEAVETVKRDVTRYVTRYALVPSLSPSLALPPDPQPTPTHSPTREGKSPRARKAEPVMSLPPGVSLDLWEDFRAMRRAIRKPMTERAETLALNKLLRFAEDGHSPAAVLEQSILNGWQDLYPPKENRNAKSSNRPGTTRSAAHAVLADLESGNGGGNQTVSHPGIGSSAAIGAGRSRELTYSGCA